MFVVIAAFFVSACGNGGNRPVRMSSPATETSDHSSAPEEKATPSSEVTPTESSTLAQENPDSNSSQDQSTPPSEPSQTSALSEQKPNEVEVKEVQPDIQSGLNNVKGQLEQLGNRALSDIHELETKVSEFSEDILAGTHSAFSPNTKERLTHHSLEKIDQQDDEVRDGSPEEAKKGFSTSDFIPEEKLRAVIQNEDEISGFLVSLLAEADIDRANVYAHFIIEEIFNEPELVRAKVVMLQLALRRLAEANLYNRDASKRMAYVQALLDEQLRADEYSELLKGGLMIVGTSAVLGGVAGLSGVEGLRRVIKRFSAGETAAESSARGAKAASLLSKGGRALSSVKATAIFKWRHPILPIPEVVQRDLRSLGLSIEQAAQLGLQRVGRKEVGYQVYRETNMPGLKFAVLNQWEGKQLNDSYRVVFVTSRWYTLHSRPEIVVTRPLSYQETLDLSQRVRNHPNEKGFFAVWDPLTGDTVPSRIEVPEGNGKFRTLFNDNELKGGAAASAGSSRLGSAMAATSSRIQSFKEGAADGLKSTVNGLVEGSRGMASRASEAAGAVIHDFDAPWALMTSGASAAALSGFWIAGYDSGKRHGRGQEVLFLESLIPAEQIPYLTPKEGISSASQ